MDDKKFREFPFIERKNAVLDAIARKEYEIEITEPNNIEERSHPDGSSFYVLMGDDAKFGVWAGSCRVTICGVWFECDLDWGEWSSSDDELIKDEDIMDTIEGIDGVIYGEHQSDEDYIEVYEAATGSKVDEYYGGWEENIPPDAEDIAPLEDLGLTPVEYNGETYYLTDDEVNGPDSDHLYRWAYGAFGESDNWGHFKCRLLHFDDDRKDSVTDEVITEVEDCDAMIDQDGWLEEEGFDMEEDW